MAVRGEASELVRRAAAGVVCEPGDPVSIARAVRQLLTMAAKERAAMGHNGRQFYEENFAFSRGADRVEAVLQEAGTRT